MVTELLSIGDGSLETWITDFATLVIDGHGSLELSDFFTKILHNDASVGRINIHRNIEDVIRINNTREPAGIESTRITIDINSTAVLRAEAEVGRMNLDRARADKVAESSNSLLEGALGFLFLEHLRISGDFGGGRLSWLFFLKHCFVLSLHK